MSPFGSRKAWAWPPNKQNAWVWPPQGASGVVKPPPPPLPASAIEYWRSDADCTPAKWIGQKLGRVLSVAGSNPSAAIVGPDPGFFNGHNVAQSAEAQAAWTSPGLASTYPAGVFPWFMHICRSRSFPTLQRGMSSAGVFSPQNAAYGFVLDPAAVNRYICGANNASAIAFTPNGVGALTPRSFKYWTDGSKINFKLEGVTYQGPYAAASPASDTVSIGTFSAPAFPPNYESPTSHAFFLVCASKPTAAEEAALDGWAAAYWGVTDDRPPLPASIHSYWYGSHGMTPANAFDQQPTGITLPGASILAADLPAVGPDADNRYFNGQPVGQGNRNAYWQQASLVTLLNTNDRPWLYVVCRMTGLLPGQQRVCGLGNNFIGLGELSVAGSPLRWQMDSFNGSWNVVGSLADAAPHRIKSWTAGTIANLSIDDVLSTATIPNAGIQTGVTSIAMFAGAIPNNPAAANIALFMICKSKPTPTEEAALDAWAKAFYGLL